MPKILGNDRFVIKELLDCLVDMCKSPSVFPTINIYIQNTTYL